MWLVCQANFWKVALFYPKPGCISEGIQYFCAISSKCDFELPTHQLSNRHLTWGCCLEHGNRKYTIAHTWFFLAVVQWNCPLSVEIMAKWCIDTLRPGLRMRLGWTTGFKTHLYVSKPIKLQSKLSRQARFTPRRQTDCTILDGDCEIVLGFASVTVGWKWERERKAGIPSKVHTYANYRLRRHVLYFKKFRGT